MNLLHDIPAGDPKDLVNVVVEIPMGSQIKYEYDKDKGIIVVDRFTYTAFTFPFNYGFIPGTWSGDEDPLDIVVVSSQSISTGILVEVRLLGMLATKDEEGEDAKLIAVPKAKVDPFNAQYNSLDDLQDVLKNKIRHFYENYKSIEPGKWVKVTGWLPKAKAVEEVEASIKRYKEHFSKK